MQSAAAIKPVAPPKRRPGRQHYISAVFELPIPPSTNALWFNVANRGRVKTEEYRAWLTEAGWMLKSQRALCIRGSVGLTVFAGLPERPRDLDNLLKPICDLLQANGIIENDDRVCELWPRGMRCD